MVFFNIFHIYIRSYIEYFNNIYNTYRYLYLYDNILLNNNVTVGVSFFIRRKEAVTMGAKRRQITTQDGKVALKDVRRTRARGMKEAEYVRVQNVIMVAVPRCLLPRSLFLMFFFGRLSFYCSAAQSSPPYICTRDTLMLPQAIAYKLSMPSRK